MEMSPNEPTLIKPYLIFKRKFRTSGELNIFFVCPRSNGLVVRAVACEAIGPGFDSNSDQMVFYLLGYKEVGKKWIQT